MGESVGFLAHSLPIGTKQVDVILEHAKGESGFVGSLEFHVVERLIFCARDRIGAVVGDAGLLGGELFDHLAAEEPAPDDAVARGEKHRF